MAILNCAGRMLDLNRVQVMGILNVTPDSFSDGGRLYSANELSLDMALQQAGKMVAAGATIIDVGGESTRPGAEPVSVQEELDRVIPVVEKIVAELDVVISIDTSSAEVITAGAAAGAGLINDVRALQREGALEAAARTDLPICLMHMQGEPKTMQQQPGYDDVVEDISEFLRQRIAACEAAGISSERLILDPGFGFGKTLEHNLTLLNRLEDMHRYGLPLLVGTSRKSMIGNVLNREPEQRLAGSLATVALAVYKGAHILRVHDVAETVDVVRMTEAVKQEKVSEQ